VWAIGHNALVDRLFNSPEMGNVRGHTKFIAEVITALTEWQRKNSPRQSPAATPKSVTAASLAASIQEATGEAPRRVSFADQAAKPRIFFFGEDGLGDNSEGKKQKKPQWPPQSWSPQSSLTKSPRGDLKSNFQAFPGATPSLSTDNMVAFRNNSEGDSSGDFLNDLMRQNVELQKEIHAQNQLIERGIDGQLHSFYDPSLNRSMSMVDFLKGGRYMRDDVSQPNSKEVAMTREILGDVGVAPSGNPNKDMATLHNILTK